MQSLKKVQLTDLLDFTKENVESSLSLSYDISLMLMTYLMSNVLYLIDFYIL